jgi:RNA polymerase sigma-32 factor
MDQRLSKNDMSLSQPVGENSDATRMDFLPALDPGVEEKLANDEITGLLIDNLKTIEPLLNEKEVVILNDRLLSEDPVTLREIGEQFGVTRERVRQIEARLLKKIREHLTDQVQDFSRDWIEEDA